MSGLDLEKFPLCLKKTPPITKTPLTDIAVGYNLRGKTIVFERTELPMGSDFGAMAACITADSNGVIAGTYNGVSVITCGVAGAQDLTFIYGDRTATSTIWNQMSFTFWDNEDIIVASNNLPSHIGGNWGFDYAFIVD